jgi:hypothetical protein
MVEAITFDPGHITVANTCLDITDSQAASQWQSYISSKTETADDATELLRGYGKIINVQHITAVKKELCATLISYGISRYNLSFAEGEIVGDMAIVSLGTRKRY